MGLTNIGLLYITKVQHTRENSPQTNPKCFYRKALGQHNKTDHKIPDPAKKSHISEPSGFFSMQKVFTI